MTGQARRNGNSVALKMGAQPSTEGAPEEAEGGGSEGHGHETASAPTVEAEMGGNICQSILNSHSTFNHR